MLLAQLAALRAPMLVASAVARLSTAAVHLPALIRHSVLGHRRSMVPEPARARTDLSGRPSGSALLSAGAVLPSFSLALGACLPSKVGFRHPDADRDPCAGGQSLVLGPRENNLAILYCWSRTGPPADRDARRVLRQIRPRHDHRLSLRSPRLCAAAIWMTVGIAGRRRPTDGCGSVAVYRRRIPSPPTGCTSGTPGAVLLSRDRCVSLQIFCMPSKPAQ